MHKLLPALLLLSCLAAETCFAQENAITVECTECRDAQEYPDDIANFAFNQIYGPDSWMPFEVADDFFVTNLYEQSVYVDVDFQFLGVGFEGFRIPLWPTNILELTLALPDGTMMKIERSVFQTSLPVPASSEEYESDDHDDSDGDDEENEEEEEQCNEALEACPVEAIGCDGS